MGDDSNINPMTKKVRTGGYHIIHCMSRSEVNWFYSKFLEISSAQLLPNNRNYFILKGITSVAAGFYWCHGRDVDTGRYFVTKSHLQVLSKC